MSDLKTIAVERRSLAVFFCWGQKRDCLWEAALWQHDHCRVGVPEAVRRKDGSILRMRAPRAGGGGGEHTGRDRQNISAPVVTMGPNNSDARNTRTRTRPRHGLTGDLRISDIS